MLSTTNSTNSILNHLSNNIFNAIPSLMSNHITHSPNFSRNFSKSSTLPSISLPENSAKSNSPESKLTPEQISELKKKADSGDANAKFDYALCLSQGNGIPKDSELSKKYLKESADLGNWTAALHYSLLLLSQISSIDKTPSDHSKPEVFSKKRELIRYLKIACKSDQPILMNEYAAYCSQFPDLLSESNEYYRLAADKGFPAAALSYILSLFRKDDPAHPKITAAKYVNIAADNHLISEADRGNFLLTAGATKEGLDHLKKLSDSGDLEATASLGHWLIVGSQGNLSQREDGLKLLRSAADKGSLNGCYELGVALLNEGRAPEAIPYLRKAYDSGDSSRMKNARTVLGAALFETRQYDEGEKLLTAAGADGDGLALFNLGLMKETIKKDMAGAAECYRKGAELGDSGAKYNYAVCLQTGKGVKRDFIAAQKLFEQIVKDSGEKDPDALYNYAISLLEARIRPEDSEKALKLMRKAAELGNVQAMGQAGLLMLQRPGKDGEEGKKMMEMAAEKGNAQAAFNLFVAYHRGFGAVKRNYAQAMKYCKMAADWGNTRAKIIMNQMKKNKK